MRAVQNKKFLFFSGQLKRVWMLCNQTRVWRLAFESNWKLHFFNQSFESKQIQENEIRWRYPVIILGMIIGTTCGGRLMPRLRHWPLYLFTVLNAPRHKYKLWAEWILVLFLVFLAAFNAPPPSFSVTPHSLHDSYCHPEALRVSSKKLKGNYYFPICCTYV